MSGQLIRQSAFSLQGKSSFVNKAKAISLLVCLGFSACSSPPHAARPDAFSQPVARISNSTIKREVDHPPRQHSLFRPLAPTLTSAKKEATPQVPPNSTASLVATSLGLSYQILNTGADFLSVCRSPRAAKIKSSLFEEAIVLAKIRSVLKQEFPKKTANSNEVQFYEGAAAIAFLSDTPVKPTTSAIVRILGISGVNRVDARFPSPSSSVPKK
jgi:hypothetical protein